MVGREFYWNGLLRFVQKKAQGLVSLNGLKGFGLSLGI